MLICYPTFNNTISQKIDKIAQEAHPRERYDRIMGTLVMLIAGIILGAIGTLAFRNVIREHREKVLADAGIFVVEAYLDQSDPTKDAINAGTFPPGWESVRLITAYGVHAYAVADDTGQVRLRLSTPTTEKDPTEM